MSHLPFRFLLLWLPAIAAASPTLSKDDLEAWFNGKDATEVNEGVLRFLTAAPSKPVHHHQNRIRITAESLGTGWTDLSQCHDNLDKVQRAQITFREGYIRDLRVVESRSIGQAWVEGPSIQLRNVDAGARLCLEAGTRALRDMGSGFFTLFNGPYMRKFLDGYYPMKVSLQLEYPASLLQLIDISPAEQPGFEVRQEPGLVTIETVFEGELRTLVQFERKSP